MTVLSTALPAHLRVTVTINKACLIEIVLAIRLPVPVLCNDETNLQIPPDRVRFPDLNRYCAAIVLRMSLKESSGPEWAGQLLVAWCLTRTRTV